jgi:hypothetical protein
MRSAWSSAKRRAPVKQPIEVLGGILICVVSEFAEESPSTG